ncbi:Alsin [Chytriomyces hyalinus]|nr:Alsin [Chytriomyces hyalinus]
MAQELSRLILHSYEGSYLDNPEFTATEPLSTAAEPETSEHDVDPTSTLTKTHSTLPEDPAIDLTRNKTRTFHGQGHAVFNSGHSYTGEFHQGFMHGKGTFVWADGQRYEGDFENNRISGTGVYTWNGGSKYIGKVENGLRNGRGTFDCCVTKSQYEGDWKEGKLSGYGKLVYNQDNSFYEGTWLSGQKHGTGTMHYESGNVYVGEWSRNVKHGQGRMVWNNRGEEYTGHWERGVPHGYGVYTWKLSHTKNHQLPMQNKYEGEWMNGKRHGHGVFMYASGARYEGEWKDNLKHGKGSCVFENGRSFIGEFCNDRPVLEAPKFQNEYPFIFDLKGMLPANADAAMLEEAIKSINTVILRHTDDLRYIYSYYCQLGVEPGTNEDNHAITRIHLWKFFDECGLKEKGSSFVDLDRAYVEHLKDDPLFDHIYKNPHDVSHHFIFRDFLDVILRVSHLLYNNKENSNQTALLEHGPAASFSCMIKTDILSALAKKRADKMEDTEPAVVPFQKTLLFEVETIFSDRVYQLYTSLTKRFARRTVTVRMLLHILNDANLITTLSGGSLTITDFIQIVETHIPGVTGDLGSYNLEFELVPYELFTTTYDCLYHKSLHLLHERAYEEAVARTRQEAHLSATQEMELLASEAAAAAAATAAAALAAAELVDGDAGVAPGVLTSQINILTPAVADHVDAPSANQKGKKKNGKEATPAKDNTAPAGAGNAASAPVKDSAAPKTTLEAGKDKNEKDTRQLSLASGAVSATAAPVDYATSLNNLRKEKESELRLQRKLTCIEEFEDAEGPTADDIRESVYHLFEKFIQMKP